MQCPHCGSEDLLPRFKFCPECSLPLPCAPINPKGREDVGGKSNKQQSRSTYGENTATDTGDPHPLTSQNQGAGHYNNGTTSINTSQYESTTYQNRGAGKHCDEEPSTKAGQRQPSASQNQGACKYDDELSSSKSGQQQLLTSHNQGANKYHDEVPSTKVVQQDPLFSQNPEVGKDRDEVRPENTNQQKPLFVKNQHPGKNVDEVPSTKVVDKQPISRRDQGANNHSSEVPSSKTVQQSPSTSQMRKAAEPSFESSGHPNTGKCQTTVGETEGKLEGTEQSECTDTSTTVSHQKAEGGNGRCTTSLSTNVKANSLKKTTEAGSPEGHGLSYINEEHSHAIDEENLRGPAVLDENNSNLPSPHMSQTTGQEQDQTVETHSDSQQAQSSYQHQHEDKVNGIEEKKLANSGQISLQEVAAPHMPNDGPATNHSTLPKKSQQKLREANNPPVSTQDHKENETLQNSAEGPLTRQQSKRKQQRNLSSSSEAGAAMGADVSCDPLGGSQDNNRGQSKEDHGAEPSGNWYRKSDAQELETKGKKGKKDKKGNVGNSELQASKALPAPSLQQVPPENGVTVVFHVLLASSFKMADASLFIRAHGEDLGNFEQNCVDMAAVAESEQYKDKDKLLYFRGQFTISLDRAHKGTFYKYLVVRKGRQFYEELLEFPPFHYNAIVDRVLKIREKDIKPGATWNQIDGVAYVSNDEGIFSWLWSSNSFSKYETLEYRTRALYFFLPKWEGFVVDGRTEKMDATEALSKLNNVVSCLSNVWTREKGNIKLRKPNNFHESKALIDYFTRKMLANFEVLKNCNAGSRQHASAVVSSLAIILIVEKYKIDLKREEISLLLRCLALDADPMEKKCSVYEAVLAEFSHGLRNYAAEAIENLCNLLIKQAWGSNSEWLLAVPLLHFLRDESKPFEEPDMTGWPKTMAWWGAEKLRIREFRVSATATKDFSQMWPLLESAFEVDRLFKRTFLRAIPVWKLSEVVSTGIFHVSDICIALVSFFPASLMAKEMVKIVEECMKAMIIILETKEDRYPIEITEFTVNVSLELTTTCIERISLRSDVETVCLSIQLLFLSINKFRESDQNQSQERESLIGNITDRLLERLGKKIGVHFKYEMDKTYIERELQVWSKLLSAANGFLGIEGYRTQLTQQFVNRASRMKKTHIVEMFCELNLDQYDGAIVESISRLAFEAVEEIINSRQGEDADHAFRTLRRGSSLKDDKRAEKYGELLSMLLTKSWPKRTGEANISSLDSVTVEFLLSWNPMTGYLKFFGDESGRGSILTPEGQETLSMAKSLLSALVERISGASITVKTLKLLQQYKDRFAQLLHADISNTEEAEETVKSLNQRIEELLEFQSLKEKLMSFVHMCDLISPVNVTTVKRNVEEDVSLCEIRQLCERKSESSVVVTSFELSPVIGEVLPKLHVVQQSVIFQGLWAQHGKRAQTARKNNEALEKDLSISKVVECVWKPAFDDWNQVAVSTFDGSLSLRDVDKFFDSYKDKKDELVQELFCILKFCYSQKHPNDKLKTVAEERAAQMQQYQQIHRYVNAAETIWEFKEAMGFTGDFKIIEDLHNQLSTEFKMKPLNTIGKKFSEAGRALACLDVNKSQCLKKVMESKRLVDWLRITIKSTQELKVLVDLALISSGESDMETDRISHLHTSCLGFAPLIFDLKETEGHEVNFDRLMEACEPVWNAVKADEGLPQKLFDTSRHLEWLKTVKESHGSVAMTSLVQAKMINSSGVYVVGRFPEQDSHEEERLSLDQVIRLTVPPKERGEESSRDKVYSLDELKDLQSKLMLIAGKAEKGKDEVDTFVKNLEGIMRLAKAYMSLVESGFVHRMHWCQEFHCSSDQRVGESIAQELARVSTDMEGCYSIWKKKVGDARREYRELNFFTTQQLMLLRKELAMACNRSQLHVENLQVFTLLESVRPSLDSAHLEAAIQRAFKDLLEQSKGTSILPSFTLTPRQDNHDSNSRGLSWQNNNYIESTPSTVGKTSQAQSISAKKPKPKGISKMQRFINAAEDEGYSEQVALCALASLGVDAEEDDLLLWCLEESDEADLESLYDEAVNNPVIAREINMEETAADQENEFDGNSGIVDESVGGSFELPQNFSEQEGNRDEDNEEVISEYLTLSQLGLILRELAVKDKGSKPRTFPAFLKRGRPNLMLVPKVDVFATVLALYMHDKDQLLPSQEEVLICSPETNTEQIELLWRRATGDLEGRFYCLVNADQLDFSVSKQAVDLLDEVTKGLAGKTGEHYGLVVICSSEKEDRANIVAALDQHRVAAPPCPSAGVIQSYLKRQFRIPPPQYGYINNSKITWNPAGSLDPEKLSVRVVSSSRGGLGKTLFVRRVTDQLPNLVNNDMVSSHSPRTSLHVTVPLHGNSTDSSMLVDSLLPHEVRSNVPLSRVFHLDVSPSVRRGLDTLLFNLLVLGSLCDKLGRLWRRRNSDLYIIEITTATPLPTGFSREEEKAQNQERQRGVSSLSKGPFYDFLPTISCASPRTVSCNLQATPDPNDFNPRMDVKEFRSPHFQRVYQYLKLSKKGENMDNFTFVPGNIDDDQRTCLTLLLSNCGIPDPSWSEIRHFVSFLNSQLRDCEESIYCDMKLMRAVLAGPDVLNLEGFRSFVVRFMIQMSRDFATPSLTDENTVFFAKDDAELERKEIEQFKLRRSWESSPHPYLFFNQDHITLTFLGFSINSNGDLVDPQTNRILEKGLMHKNLRIGLQAQRVDFGVNTVNWNKAEKIMKLCSVIGAQWINRNPNFDPDPAYELTTDNVKKIMAIHMRFRCNIPVIVMGETGCGKTRLIRYMCGLQAGPKPGPRNMLLVKVHGGTTYEDIEAKVKQAEKMAEENQDKNIDTVLFFDEANTTEALSMIKEVMVDRRIRGRRVGLGQERLQFIAACNPYRRHTDDMIYKLESAGLGYHVKTEESDDRLGHIPLRHLVYRVHALPGSMRPLIWDFGQLNHKVESLYTNQIVSRYILLERKLPGDSLTVRAVASVLAASQKYMRDQSDECSFVSLRDVERAMQVMVWFYNHVDMLGRLMRNVINEQRREEGDDSDEEDDDFDEQELIDPVTRALVLAIGVCYHAKLQDRRKDFRNVVAQSFEAPCALSGGGEQILREISSCQRAVLNELVLGPNIARNTALSENVFMMVVCIELRIPLFVVGKPGSSKSLAKTVVADNMQGDAARSELFRSLKQVHMASYQCSPLSTPDGIVGTFRQCRKLQEGKNLDRFVSVVVLDEVGLAEDSPLMPLKTLHPLLEDGVTSSDDVIETEEKPQRVAFIGISNWALDPAKMNRGIMLSRGVPDVQELKDSALGICSTNKRIKNLIQPLIPPLANGYAELYKEQKDFETLKKCDKEEFFGLRDFYSLVKMVYAIAAKSGQRPGWHQLEHAIRRNFGGLIERKPVEIFKRQLPNVQDSDDDPEVRSLTTIRLIEASLAREDVADQTNFSENRYLLILTENYAALGIIQQHLLKTSDDAVVIFGSSFPNDQEYTQICRNINRIKVCMETGRTVILLNLESLYESLYDALNQYYVYLGGQKYVDLGLGTHRVKCRVHDDFKLIVIAEKEVVYNRFPIPLINRLEKHFLVTSTSLTSEQMRLVEKLQNWVNDFAEVTGPKKCSRVFSIGDSFVGFHEDTIPSVVMQVCNNLEEEQEEDDEKEEDDEEEDDEEEGEKEEDDSFEEETKDPWEDKIVRRCKNMLLEMATPDAIARLPASGLKAEAKVIWNVYFHEQQHSSLAAFMSHMLESDKAHLKKRRQEGLLVQITTHSRLLSKHDLSVLCDQTAFRRSTVDFMALQQFQTEQQFRTLVRFFFERLGGGCPGILIVQCDSGDDNFNLIAGARHILMEERNNAPELLNLAKIEPVHIVLVVQLPRISGGCRNFVGFQGGKWMSVHIDELRPPGGNTPSIEHLIDRPISELFRDGNQMQPETGKKAQMLAINLLRNCVQAAACRVDNEAGSCDRSTQRIELLLQLLPENFEKINDEMTFASVLVQRTYNLVKESESTAYSASQWLYAEALSGTGVQEWGTFRKALWKRVYSSVVPILAEIIALADTDSNLDLMKNGSSWLPTLWLRILANPNISELHYSKIISPVTNTVRERVQVLGSGAGGHTFQCMFPFSFLIKQEVDKLLQSASSVAVTTSTASLVECLRDLIKTSETGRLFDGLRNEYLQALPYLSDYVHMVYKPSSTREHELVCEAVISSARELGLEKDEDGNELLDMALIHVGHSRIQSRLRCFAKLVQAQPNVVPRLRENFRENESEVLLDVVALHISLEEFNPSDEVLLDPDSARKWCDRVLSIRQSVEVMMGTERFQAATETTSNYGDKAKMLIGLCRSMWQRAGAVRLFVEHVTSLNEKNSGFNSESVLRLWKALGEETDFSSLASLKTIEKFLISYNEEALKRGDESEYRRQCNAFFMELVSLFCFGESSRALEEDALSHLMRYVIGQQSTHTRDFSPFPDYQIDPTPVVRSFLLQQLLRSSQSFVKEHLDVFLQEAQNLQPEPQHIIQVCFLCVQCMEDNLISRYQAKISDSKLTVKLKHAKKICDEVFAAFETAASYTDEPFLMNANALESVAKGRYVLTLVANYLYKFFIEGDSKFSNDLDVQREFKYLLESVKRLCLESASTTPQLFLVRQLVRRYGFDCVRTLGRFQELQWIIPPEARQQEESVIQDRFVVHNKQYRDAREGLAKGIISGNIEDFADAMTEIEGEGVYKDVLLLLVLYREVTLVNASSQRQNVSDKVKEKLVGFLRSDGNLSTTAQPFAMQLLQNDQGGDFRDLEVFPGKSAQDHTLAEIVIHASIAIQCVGSGSLTEPLYTLMTYPQSMVNSYLPTIPEDNFLDCIKVIVGETMKESGRPGEWYECGYCKHPYFIGECSQPMEKSQCPDCGRVLGGEQHRFLGDYAVAKRQDRTKTGHALGDSGSRPTVAEPQRNLSPILCSLVRIVMHAAMVMGASRNAQATAQLITPSCQPDLVAQFLWRHLQRDLDLLGRALGRSVDDAALTVHLVLHRMISLNGGQTANAHDMRLSTRESRRNWETEFSSVVIAPVVKQLDQNLQKALKLLMEDERFGSDPLVRQLYEFEEQIEDLSHGLRPMTRSLWKYRRQVTIEQLGNALQQATESSDDSQHKVLSAFLKQEHKLRCVQFLPDIVRLQRLLMDRFHRRIDRTDAENFTIREFLQKLQRGPVKEEFNRLIQRFKLAWNSCRSFLSEQGRLRVPQDLCNITMDNDCSIAMLLPSTKGMSVCSMALLFFLVNTNDEFLGIYRSATNQESPLERISMTDVTISQLIAYDPERDLLPLILAHSNYSLEVGQETFVQYDWTALERQLTDRFLKGRPFVVFKEERFAFSRDTRDDNVFASLADKIPQEAVSRAIEAQVISDLRSSLSDVCDVLSSLDIAIGFLSSSGGQKTMSLKCYLHEVLKLPRERGLKSPTAEQHCYLSHTLAMWRLMALEKAKIKSRNNQEPFEEMSDVFKVKLSSSAAAHLNRVLRKIDMEQFLPQLLEMILLKVKHAEENIADMSFPEYLELYLADKNLAEIPGTENIPENVHMKHLQVVWSSAVQLCDDFRGGSQSLSA